MMSGIKSKDTKPEIYVRKLLHASGYRFRLHRKDLPGKPDIVLPKYNVAIFVHGCFWHGHENCHLFRLPKSRTEFWKQKIGANRNRDLRKTKSIREHGWRMLIIRECALKGKTRLDTGNLASKVFSFMENRHLLILEIEGRGRIE